MHIKAIFCATLVGSTTAQTLSSRSQYARLHDLSIESTSSTLSPADVRTLVSIKTALRRSTEAIKEVNSNIKGITSANAKQQLATVGSSLQKVSSTISADTKKIKSSGAIGIGEILGLLQEAPRNELLKDILDVVTAINGTFTEIGNKQGIVKKDGSLVDIVAPGIKSLRQGIVDIVAIVPSQVPSIVKGPIDSIIGSFVSKAGAPPAGGDAPAAIAPPAPAPAPASEDGAAPKGKGGKGTAGKGGAKGTTTGKGAAPKSTGKSGSGASSGITLNTLLASPESQENIGKAVDRALDQIIGYLRGTTNTIIPKELLDQVFPNGPPEGIPKALVGSAPKPAPAPAAQAQ